MCCTTTSVLMFLSILSMRVSDDSLIDSIRAEFAATVGRRAVAVEPPDAPCVASPVALWLWALDPLDVDVLLAWLLWLRVPSGFVGQ